MWRIKNVDQRLYFKISGNGAIFVKKSVYELSVNHLKSSIPITMTEGSDLTLVPPAEEFCFRLSHIKRSLCSLIQTRKHVHTHTL